MNQLQNMMMPELTTLQIPKLTTLEMPELTTLKVPNLTSLQAEKMTTLTLSEMKTINLNSDMNYEGVMNARNMVLHVKDLTFIDLSGNRRTLSEVIGELSKSNGDSSSIDSSSN